MSMRPSTAKIVRDLWIEKGRSALAILAMALGVASFTSVLSGYAIIDRELNQGYLGTNPASFTLRIERVSNETVELISKDADVEQVEARRAVGGRVKAGPAQWRNATFFVIRDFASIKISKITHEEGVWPPGPGDVLIERDAFQVAKVKIGEPLVVRTSKGQEITLKTAGRVHDVGQAQARMENSVYAYIDSSTLPLLGEEEFFDRVLVVVSGDRFDRAHIESVAERVKSAIEAQGVVVKRVDVPEPGKHPHADIMGMLLLAISAFGLLVLAFAAVLVMNLLTALMATQVRQIGVMKAIGGTRSQIARIYLAQALALGVAAVLIGLPLGLLGARALCLYLAGFLNFDMTSFAVPVWVYLLVAVVGLITPLLAAAIPVARGTRVTVREALADFGVGDREFGHDWLDRRLSRIGGLARPVLLGLRNTFRRRVRLALTLMTLSAAGIFFMSALNVRATMIGSLDRLFSTRLFDVSVALSTMYPYETAARAIATSPLVIRTEGWIATEASIVEPVNPSPRPVAASGDHGAVIPSNSRFTVFGIPPRTEMLHMEMSEGRMPGVEEVDGLVVNSALATRYPALKPGAAVRLRIGPSESTWKVTGISREPFSPSSAYVSRAYFDQAGGHEGMTNSLRVILRDADQKSVESFKEDLDRKLNDVGIRVLGASSKKETRYGFDQHMLMIYVFLIVMSLIVGSVGALGLMTTMSLNVLERRREMGVLRAIGASVRTVWLIVVTEGLVVGLLAMGIAMVLAVPVSRVLAEFIGAGLFGSQVDFALDLNGLLIWLVASLVLSVGASFIPAWNAARVTVREALTNE